MKKTSLFEEFKASMKPKIKELKFMLDRVSRSPLSIIGASMVLFFATIAILAPVLAPPFPSWDVAKLPDPYFIPRAGYKPEPSLPSPQYPFGLTEGSYDLYYGCVWGTITAWRVGIYVVGINIIIAIIVGSISGYYGGIVDEALMRFTDIILAFPGLILAMAFIAALPSTLTFELVHLAWILLIIFAPITLINLIRRQRRPASIFGAITIICIIGITILPGDISSFKLINLKLMQLDKVLTALVLVGWPSYTRLLRGEVLRVKNEDYIEAAKAAGCSDLRIIVKHLLPNSIYPLLIAATLDIGAIVLTAAALSFLGLGSESGYADWGRLVQESTNYVTSTTYWHTYLIPGVFIVGFCLSWNLLGDALRDIFDPTLRRR